MNNPNTTPGKTYAVTSPNGCTVTTDDGLTLAEIEAGKQGYFVAVSGNVTLSDDSAILTPVFKLAPWQKLALLGVLGGNAGGLPAGYKQVEYLEGDGNQVIITGLVPDNETGFKASVQMPVTPANGSYFVGTQVSTSREAFWIKYVKPQLVMQRGGSNSSDAIFVIATDDAANINARNDIEFNYKNNRLWGFTGQAGVKIAVEMKEEQLYWFALFKATYRSNSMYDPSSRFRIFKWQHSQGEIVVRSYIPALDETGAPCLFDLVSRQPFYNVGTGDFTYPTAATTYGLRRVLPDWGKLTENGLRRLYLAPAGYQGELYDYALENGFKPIVEPEQPDEGYWAPLWRETEDEIVLEWVETEPPMDEFGMPAEPLTNN